MKIIYYNIHYYSESFFAFILFILLCLSLFTLFYLMTEKFDNENKNNNSLKILLLNFGFCLLLFINFIFIGNLAKKPFLSIKYTNDNINQETIKNKKEIVNDIINGNVFFEYNNCSKYYNYKFEITKEEANQIEEAKEKFDKKNKEIEQENENKAKTGNVKFTD